MPSDGDWPEGFSLDTRRGYSTQLIGLSNETDPFLLRHFQYDMFDNYYMCRLIYRKMTDDVTVQSHINSSTAGGTPEVPASEVPVHFQVFDDSICDENVKAIERDFSVYNSEAEDCDLLYKIVPKSLGFRLSNLFFKFVQPSYPVFSARDYERINTNDGYDLPVGLKAAMYALAMPFCFMDDQLSASLVGPTLPATIAEAPANFAVGDLPGLWALSCSALAAAESLGLHLDPSNWRLPRWEARLRKRLWWIVYSDHTWRALVSGRPSHLRSDSWIVPRLWPEDLEADEYTNEEVGNVIRKQSAYSLALFDLSMIANDILTDL
ncbi:fungal-specific transcription factor domain-containing protein [Penicillium lagena]|uniref:fungal-specific transcription factor domain-containing protein n=1 Tax=Penicillium lagena TaxID=94218 RepID=UPI0025416FEF|nr:fungal-specific transcription factor domain-containing protein [Penicillium lagena]KAJ5610331.1 fungal-specific transcription factor domain-containing protein [Penicillium lagena]